MISTTLQVLILIAIAMYFVLLIYLLKKKTLILKYTLLWICSGFLMFLLAAFPRLLDWISQVIGIYSPTNALFALALFCILIILVSLTAIVSKMNERNKKLIQAVALLNRRVQTLDRTGEE